MVPAPHHAAWLLSLTVSLQNVTSSCLALGRVGLRQRKRGDSVSALGLGHGGRR